jgi:hypothetical protein
MSVQTSACRSRLRCGSLPGSSLRIWRGISLVLLALRSSQGSRFSQWRALPATELSLELDVVRLAGDQAETQPS